MTSHPPHIHPPGTTVDDIPTDVGQRAGAAGEDDVSTDVAAQKPGAETVGPVNVQAPEPKTEEVDASGAEVPSPARAISKPSLSSRRLPAAVAGVALLVASAALFVGLSSDPEQIYVVEERAPAPRRSSPTAQTTPPPGADGVDPGELTRRIAEQESAIRRCFELDSSVAAEGAVRLRFTLDGDGVVSSAEVLPASVAATETGRCLVDLGRRTTFPPTGSALAFEIPLRTRVLPTGP